LIKQMMRSPASNSTKNPFAGSFKHKRSHTILPARGTRFAIVPTNHPKYNAMRLHQITAALIAIALTSANPVSAQLSFAKPDRNGDYFSNYTPIQAKSPKGRLMAGSLWQVVASGLNCRGSAGTQAPIVRSFKKGTILQANVGRGGSDEVHINWKDKQGQPWMPVRSEAGAEYDCAVRANSRYIKPYTGK
jgi:hypothetical protein